MGRTKMTKLEAAAAARAARTLIKRRRWAAELREAGWTVTEPAGAPN